MNLKELSLVELKALAYDLLSQLDYTQKNLQLVNQELSLRVNNEPTTAEEAPSLEPIELLD